jgi:FdrA protein
VTDRVLVRRNTYYDSVTLMLASRDAEQVAGVDRAAAVTATPVNLALLAEQGFDLPDDLGPDDLVVAVRARGEDAAVEAMRVVETILEGRMVSDTRSTDDVLHSLRSAARARRDVNVAFVSVPGRYAAYEVASAIESGLHVFCFSDGISLADEAALKRRASDKDLLFMGADCGTAIIDGVSFGFANAVTAGPVGVIGASGTGIQLVTCLLDSVGVGISHAIGVGGRDLSAEVGGAETVQVLDLLAADPATETVTIISKPPDRAVAERVAEAAAACGKPVVMGLLGPRSPIESRPGVEVVGSLEEVAVRAAARAGRTLDTADADLPERPTPGDIRGLFCGGSLCIEAETAAGATGFIDFGADEYTEGRAHPMIDPTLRNEHFARVAADPDVAAIVVDVVLGYGAHPDPATELAPLIETAQTSVIAVVCGTDGDPQGLSGQSERLTKAGAVVTRNAAHAGRLARAAVDA